MIAAFVAALVALTGGVLGWFFVPWASDRSLRQVRQRSDAWWSDSLKAYETFKEERSGREPNSEVSGLEGALGIWRDDACREALVGRLSSERLEMLSMVGIKVAGLSAYGSEQQRATRYSYRASGWHRMLFSVGLCVAFAAAALFVSSPVALGALCVCVLVMTVAVVCDLRARTIPLETCFVLGLFGMVFQVSLCGLEGLVAGVVFALMVVVGASCMNRIMQGHCPEGAVGRGDMRCMGALALATGGAALSGFAACYLLAGLGSAVGCATKKLTWTSGIPMAPFLAVWLVVGSAICLL